MGLLGQAALAQNALPVSEREFLSDLPVVLSVSRLPQRLDDTPGAVTVIDRATIRRSGARDLADLLRLVPGFQASSAFEADAPQVSYHGGFSEYSNRIQVLVDGRSVYSPFLIGSVALGLQTVALSDIDHIEVLRGSNSAAYGARAFLGVINIVTQDAMATLGAQGGLTVGQDGVRDAQARVGWGDERAAFRLSLDRRGDDGLDGSNGHNAQGRVNMVADLRPTLGDELQLRAGALDLTAGLGFANRPDKALHDRNTRSNYLQLDWRRTLSPNEDIAVSVSHANETYGDSFPLSLQPYGINGSVDVSASGRAANDTVSLQHTVRSSPEVRWVWGVELRREEVASRALYGTDAALATRFDRLFGNVEWRLTPSLLLNAGLMAEHSTITDNNLAPRLMFNWHLDEGQTLRAGVSKAFRPPSSFEKFSDVGYSYNGTLLQVTTRSRGNIDSEYVTASELGYLGLFPRLGLELDVRVFNERIEGFVRRQKYALPRGATLLPSSPWDYVNDESFTLQGVEYQLKCRPWVGAELMFNQAYTVDGSRDTGTQLAAPRWASNLVLFQKLPRDLDLSLIYQNHSTETLQGSNAQFALTRVDLRLATALRLGGHKGELALAVQNLGSDNHDFDPLFLFKRRAFVSLTLEN
jgi:iron complex outermembrane receptor protein